MGQKVNAVCPDCGKEFEVEVECATKPESNDAEEARPPFVNPVIGQHAGGRS